ncbi:hypothetical protein BH10ACI2_BH10ACI2_04230 [soil metagenome]
MTDAERENEKKRAKDLGASIGGILAILLGLALSGSTPASPLLWDPGTGRYIFEGHYVSAETVRNEMLRLRTNVGNRMARTTDRFTAGEISIDQWKDEIKGFVASSHILAAALASGSIAFAFDDPAVESRIESEMKFADGFADDIRKKKLRTPTIKSRARSYMQAAIVTFAVVTHAVKKAVGYTEARRHPTAAESCRGCLDYANEWMDIDAIPQIGTLQCGPRCLCWMEYR